MGTKRKRDVVAFGEACALVDEVLPLRGDIVAHAADAATFGDALGRLRDRMRANSWTAPRDVRLDAMIKACDARTRRDGFHVLHDWDGRAGRVNPDVIPVDVLHFIAGTRAGEPPDRAALAILLDYYLLNILALLSLRAWDDGNAGANLEWLHGLLERLQGEGGSGERFCDDAETLLLVATCHYEPEEHGYRTLLDAVRTLDVRHRVRIALGHASSMGSHLRFGFEATYARDTVKMRDDNVADYPWLCFALVTLIDEYARLRESNAPASDLEPVVEALANGFLADPAAFLGTPPESLSSSREERLRFREIFAAYRGELIDAFERHRPTDQGFSPFAFFFNFSHNVIKGIVVDAVIWGEPWRVSFNDLLTALPGSGSAAAERRRLATTLMGYARTHPDRIRGQLMPVIVYDPVAGRQAFGGGMRKVREYEGA